VQDGAATPPGPSFDSGGFAAPGDPGPVPPCGGHRPDFEAVLSAPATVRGPSRARVLVAGIGNIFFADDGFGPEVARRLGEEELPDWVKVEDFGIRSIHLAYELMEGYDELVLIDATPRKEDEPGTVYLIEPDFSELEGTLLDAHTMNPATVFSMLDNLGGEPPRTVIVGVEPLSDDEDIGLSPPVAAAVDAAVQTVKEVLAGMSYGANGAPGPTTRAQEPGAQD
jgi:hydrogenase maturation protease